LERNFRDLLVLSGDDIKISKVYDQDIDWWEEFFDGEGGYYNCRVLFLRKMHAGAAKPLVSFYLEEHGSQNHFLGRTWQ
jgi:hypothetical protein